jgi:hypothetical protein
VVDEGPFQLLSEHPVRKMHRKQIKEAERTQRLNTVDTSKVRSHLRGPVEKTMRIL